MKGKGWYGDRERHSLASKGIRTSEIMEYKRRGDYPSLKLINELDNDLNSECANGIIDSLKSGYASVKEKYASAKESYAEKKESAKEGYEDWKKGAKQKYASVKKKAGQVKDIASDVGKIAKNVATDVATMGAEMMEGASAFINMVETIPEPSEKAKVLEEEIYKIDSDIALVRRRIKDRKEEIRNKRRAEDRAFDDWLKLERESYKELTNSIKAFAIGKDQVDYQLRVAEINFQARVQEKQNQLNVSRVEDVIDIRYMTDLISDLDDLKKELNRIKKKS